MTEQNPKSATTILEDPDSKFKIWNDELDLLLSGNNLYQYIEEGILAYEIYNILKKTYTNENNERIRIFEKELGDLKLDVNKTVIMHFY